MRTLGLGLLVLTWPVALQAQWTTHSFKESRTLQLDTTRVALFGGDGSLEGFDRVDGMEVAGWRLATLKPAVRSAEDVLGDIAGLSALSAAPFISPVFEEQGGGPLVVTPVLLVQFGADVTRQRCADLLERLAPGEVLDSDWAGMPNAFRVRSDARTGFEVLDAASRLAALPETIFAEPDMIFTGRGELIPNDPGFANCWGLNNTGQFSGVPGEDMDAVEAWDRTVGDPRVIVAVFDTGAQQDHPDIHQIPGEDFTTDPSAGGGPVNSCDRHGTPVSGAITATINNALGTVGVAPGCLSAHARCFISSNACNDSWASTASWTVDALAWAESIGARVTNNSNTYTFTSSAIATKYEQTRMRGMIHFASSGNSGQSSEAYPASLSSVHGVSAVGPDGLIESFSNTGNGLSFAAPGAFIYTTDQTGSAGYVDGDYAAFSGTSFSSPYCAGVAALVLSANPYLKPGRADAIMMETARDKGTPGPDPQYGFGFVNANAAIARAFQEYPVAWMLK